MQINLGPEKIISILIADDHKLIREMWQFLFEKDRNYTIVGQANNGDEAIELARELNPDVILMDINMGTVSGIEAAATILKNNPASRIIAVSMNLNLAIVKRVLKLGLFGYVSKSSGLEELRRAVLDVHNGSKYVCREVKDLMLEAYVQDDPPGWNLITFREMTILPLITQGLSSREIASNLGISTKTVEVHRYNILKKTKFKNTAALVNYCSQNEKVYQVLK